MGVMSDDGDDTNQMRGTQSTGSGSVRSSTIDGIHKHLEPFFGAYDKENQPHLLDIDEDKLTFDYLKWRPKLVQQLYDIYLRGWLTTPTMPLSTQKRTQLLVLSEAFEQTHWRWTPIGLKTRTVPHHNELHDIPIEWHLSHLVEAMCKKIERLEQMIDSGNKKN